MDPAPPRLVDAGLDAGESMRVLFKDVFGHEMTPGLWHWKYGPGRGQGVGLVDHGRMVAHFGGMTRRVSYLGQPALACQVCDVMVAPAARSSLSRSGPIQRVSAAFLEQHVGDGRAHRVGFGFPNHRAFKVGERLGLYAAVDEVVQASWVADPLALSGSGLRVGDPGPAALTARPSVADRLWAAMRRDLPDSILGVRDAAWLNDRYLSHPVRHYVVTVVRGRWLRRPLGLIVTRQVDGVLELLDLLGPVQSFETLIRCAREKAATLGCSHVRAWITQSHARLFPLAPGSGADVVPIQVTVPANVHTPGPSPQSQRDRWFLMGGDADFT